MPMKKWSDPTYLKFFREGGLKVDDDTAQHQFNERYRAQGKDPPTPTTLELQAIHRPSIQYVFDAKACPGIKTGR